MSLLCCGTPENGGGLFGFPFKPSKPDKPIFSSLVPCHFPLKYPPQESPRLPESKTIICFRSLPSFWLCTHKWVCFCCFRPSVKHKQVKLGLFHLEISQPEGHGSLDEVIPVLFLPLMVIPCFFSFRTLDGHPLFAVSPSLAVFLFFFLSRTL